MNPWIKPLCVVACVGWFGCSDHKSSGPPSDAAMAKSAKDGAVLTEGGRVDGAAFDASPRPQSDMGTTPKDASGNTDALVGLDCAARKCPVGWCGRLDELCPGQYSAGWVQCTGCSACQEVEAQAREHIAQIQSCSDHDTCVVTTISSGGFDVFQLYCRTPFYQRQGADTKLETLKTLSEKWNKACRRGFFVDCESPGPEPAPGACIQGKCQAQPNADRG